MVHDVQMDYYARRLATCSSDHTIKIFDVANDTHSLVAQLAGHTGPVWQVSWAHPRFGNIIASCGYDRNVIIWKEQENVKNSWVQIYKYSNHQYSVNSIAWSPQEYGLCLACASSDGCVSVIQLNDDETWNVDKFEAHNFGANSVSWAPASSFLMGFSTQPQVRRLVTGGCDCLVKIWVSDLTQLGASQQSGSNWVLEHSLTGHKDWVRDVQWAPNVGTLNETIASGSQDGTVYIWTSDNSNQASPSTWSKQALKPELGETIWRLSWSLTGNILAVSSGDDKVTLWKEAIDRKWTCLTSINEKKTEQQSSN
ncbi:uncharacterized protein LOC126330076 [Schistocerca gregaria]|uniref:uncharacterized protein LOC126330076 n=1 Tax=Schistocerca gregaria TaxID=7010 RepID=UPI00211EB876|nr:uncharacterized protein LOC126330076 [Schistocerca gregaria]